MHALSDLGAWEVSGEVRHFRLIKCYSSSMVSQDMIRFPSPLLTLLSFLSLDPTMIFAYIFREKREEIQIYCFINHFLHE
jgi:hypothetical protein